jgi:hypothetical protein
VILLPALIGGTLLAIIGLLAARRERAVRSRQDADDVAAARRALQEPGRCRWSDVKRDLDH